MRRSVLTLLATALVSCSTVMDNDAGTDAHRADVPPHADVQPDTDVAELRDDGPLDVIEDRMHDVVEDLFDAPAPPLDVADVVDAQPEDARPGQDAMTCNCPAPAADVTTFSIGSVTDSTSTVQQLRSDYSSAAGVVMTPVLLNGQASLQGNFNLSFYDQTGRKFTVACNPIFTDASGVRTTLDFGRACNLTVQNAAGAGIAASMTANMVYSFANLTDTSADIIVQSLNTTSPRFDVTNIRVHLVRPRGGLTVPGTALTP